jgi:hypothetical protein
MPRPATAPSASGTFPFAAVDETFVYRAYCRCGDLLHVGMTNDLARRIAQHKRLKAPWTSKAVRLEWELYPTRYKAEIAERRQIQGLYPLYNTVDSMPRPPRSVDLPWPRSLTEDERDQRAIATYRGVAYLDWMCSEMREAA